MLRPYEKLRKVSNYADYSISDQIEVNLNSYFDWGFVNIGAFSNISTGTILPYGSRDAAQLRLSNDRNYAVGRVWEGFRKNWVYESGYDYVPAALTVSGVYVDGTFYPSGTTGVYSHTVDYPGGRVIFNSGLPTGSVVKAEFSYKYIQCITSDSPTWLQLQTRTLRGDDTHFEQYSSGVYSIFSSTRAQLPLVIFQVTSDRNYLGYQLGDSSQKCNFRINAHVYSETELDKKRITDIICNQNQATVRLFDQNIMNAADFPLTSSGTLRSGARSYPSLISDFYLNKDLIIKNTNSRDLVAQPGFYQAIVGLECEVLV